MALPLLIFAIGVLQDCWRHPRMAQGSVQRDSEVPARLCATIGLDGPGEASIRIVQHGCNAFCIVDDPWTGALPVHLVGMIPLTAITRREE